MAIKILHLEDLPSDAELINRVLKKGNLDFEIYVVDTKHEFENLLDSWSPHIILSDHSLPSFDSFGALRVLKEKSLNIPFILITSAMSEEFSVEVMKQGADDYILKDRLYRLPNAILNALEKKRIEEEHQKFLNELIVNEALLKETEHLANIGSFKIDLTNNIIKWSDQLYLILDYEASEVVPEIESFPGRIHPLDQDRITTSYKDAIVNSPSLQLDYRIVTRKGYLKFVRSELLISRNEFGQAVQLTGFIQDITGQKKAEEKIHKAYRLYAFISQINQTIIHSINETNVFREVCHIAVNTGRFDTAWVGIVNAGNSTISLIEECEVGSANIHYLKNLSFEGNLPKEYVVKVGTYYVCNDIEKDPDMANSKSFAAFRGFGSCIMLPIKKANAVYGVFNLYASEINFFDFEEIKLLEEVVGNISFALDNFEKEKQRKLAQEKLAYSEAILKEAQAIAHIGNWSLNLATGKAEWSEEACRIYGLGPEEKFQTMESWLSFVHPEDLKLVLQNRVKTLTSGTDASFHHRIVKKDGTVRYIHSQTRPQLNAEGHPIGINGVTHDVTEEKRAELSLREKELLLRGILDSTDNGILAVDNNDKIISFNQRFNELWHIPEGIEVKEDENLLLEHIISELSDPDALIRKVNELKNTDGTSFDLLEMKDGRVLERFSTPLILSDKFVGRVWSFRDISERRKHIQAIEAQNAQLNEIAWIQSHVVRAPLSRIMGLINALKNYSDDKELSFELLGFLFSSAEELDDVIGSIVSKTEQVGTFLKRKN